MPINPNQQLDPNKRRYGLPLDSVVGNGVGDPHAGGKSIGKAAAQKGKRDT